MPLIDADTLWKVFENAGWWDNADRDVAQDLLDKAPTVDAEPVQHGRWIPMQPYLGFMKCSVCGMIWETESPHCPSCGAKMDKGEQNVAN